MSFAAFTLHDFLAESNSIEGIPDVRDDLLVSAKAFLAKTQIVRQDLVDFVKVAQPDAVIRDQPNLNIQVGTHIAPRGGPEIIDQLDKILDNANLTPFRRDEAYGTHVAYENLHPFTDGNGRSGRILWLWMMGGIERLPLGFLHTWHYQSLQASYYQSQHA